jgi:hypothetical protein
MLKLSSSRRASPGGCNQIATIDRLGRSMSWAAAAAPRSAAGHRRTIGNGDLRSLACEITAMADDFALISINFFLPIGERPLHRRLVHRRNPRKPADRDPVVIRLCFAGRGSDVGRHDAVAAALGSGVRAGGASFVRPRSKAGARPYSTKRLRVWSRTARPRPTDAADNRHKASAA